MLMLYFCALAHLLTVLLGRVCQPGSRLILTESAAPTGQNLDLSSPMQTVSNVIVSNLSDEFITQ
jgi:Na+/H+-dicarboxylate symporter